jgi:hypothetical protein
VADDVPVMFEEDVVDVEEEVIGTAVVADDDTPEFDTITLRPDPSIPTDL